MVEPASSAVTQAKVGAQSFSAAPFVALDPGFRRMTEKNGMAR